MPSPSWSDHFNRNMKELGVPTPEGAFETLATTLATLTALEEAIRVFGPRVTIHELARAGYVSDKLLAAGALAASYYVGAVVGSALVATSRSLFGMGPEDIWISINELNSRYGNFSFDVDGYMYNSPAFAPAPDASSVISYRSNELSIPTEASEIQSWEIVEETVPVQSDVQMIIGLAPPIIDAPM